MKSAVRNSNELSYLKESIVGGIISSYCSGSSFSAAPFYWVVGLLAAIMSYFCLCLCCSISWYFLCFFFLKLCFLDSFCLVKTLSFPIRSFCIFEELFFTSSSSDSPRKPNSSLTFFAFELPFRLSLYFLSYFSASSSFTAERINSSKLL